MTRAERAIISILQGARVGRENAIPRGDLLNYVNGVAWANLSERELREAIKQLRRDGQPICSTGGKGGGYFWAANWDELHAFIRDELRSRARDLLYTARQMRVRNRGRLHDDRQMRMFA